MIDNIVFEKPIDRTMTTPLPAAGLIRRFGAMLYETFLLLALLFIADYLFISLTHNAQSPALKMVLRFYLLAVIAVYFTWFWSRGQSLAMKTWRIRLTTSAGSKLKLHHAFIRFLLAMVLVGLSQLWVIFDRDRQFLHDRLAGTRLVSCGD